MNWDALSAIAEMIGSIAILVTLIFLIVQVRHNSLMIKNSTLQHGHDGYADVLNNIFSNTEVFEIYYKGIRNQLEDSPKERQRFELLMFRIFQVLDAQYQQYLNGGADQAHWEKIVGNFMSTVSMPGARASWERQKDQFPTDLHRELDKWLPDES